MRSESGSSLLNGRTPWTWRIRHCPGAVPLQIDERGRPALAAGVLGQPPAPEVMRAGHHARPDGLGHPHPVDEVADAGGDLQEVAGADAEPRRVLGMQPERVACARSRRATWRCPSACGSGWAAGRSGAAPSRPASRSMRDSCDVAPDVARARPARATSRPSSVGEKNSSLREGVGKPTQARPSISTPTGAPPLATTLVTGSTAAPSRSFAPGGLLVGPVDAVLDQERAVLAHDTRAG